MRKASPETELRIVKRQLREALTENTEYRRECVVLRGQLSKAQGEAGEWKRRFDTLLAKAKRFDIPS